jgi:uncharacterized membrane protein YdbT with pleckstrin-like domain
MVSYRSRLFATHEEQLRQAHRHVLFVLLHTLPLILAALILWGLAFLAYRFEPPFEGYIALGLIVLSLIPLGMALYRFLWWRAEEYIVTNLRIVQVEGILSKRMIDSSLGKVNDVEMKQSMFGRMFDYGDIDILTGSETAINDLHGIDQPLQFKMALLEAKARFEGQRMGPDRRPDYLEKAQSERNEDSRPSSVPVEAVEDTARVLAALSELRNSGVLTEAEYQEKLRSVMKV